MAAFEVTTSDSTSAPDDGAEPSARQLTTRGRDRRQALLEFATQQFARNGFHPTSVSDIVDGNGVGKGVFYWYFPSKDALLLEILREALIDLRGAQREAIEAGSDPLRRLELGIRASLRWSGDNPDVLRLVMFAWTEETFAKAMRRGRRIMIDDTAKHIAEAMEQGLIADGDPTLLATGIRGVTEELGRQYAVANRPISDDVIDHAVRMCLFGVSGDVGARSAD